MDSTEEVDQRLKFMEDYVQTSLNLKQGPMEGGLRKFVLIVKVGIGDSLAGGVLSISINRVENGSSKFR